MKVTNTDFHDFSVVKGQEIIIANEVEGEWALALKKSRHG